VVPGEWSRHAANNNTLVSERARHGHKTPASHQPPATVFWRAGKCSESESLERRASPALLQARICQWCPLADAAVPGQRVTKRKLSGVERRSGRGSWLDGSWLRWSAGINHARQGTEGSKAGCEARNLVSMSVSQQLQAGSFRLLFIPNPSIL
jgi:hypothetical protein